MKRSMLKVLSPNRDMIKCELHVTRQKTQINRNT